MLSNNNNKDNDLATVVETQKSFISELLDRLEKKEITKKSIELDFEKHSAFKKGGKLYTIGQIFMLLNDDYFHGLTIEQIVELAKKSIRLTKENCELRNKIEDLTDEP